MYKEVLSPYIGDGTLKMPMSEGDLKQTWLFLNTELEDDLDLLIKHRMPL